MLSKGYITDEELRGARAESQERGEALENALVRLGPRRRMASGFGESHSVGISGPGKEDPGQPVSPMRICRFR